MKPTLFRAAACALGASLLFAGPPTLRAEDAAPTAPDTANFPLGSAEGKQINSKFQDAINKYYEGDFAQAALKFQELLEMNPEPDMIVAMRNEAGYRVFQEMLKNETLEGIAQRFLDIARKREKEVARDPERIKKLVEILQTDEGDFPDGDAAKAFDTYQRAITALVKIGQYASPHLIPLLGDKMNETVRAHGVLTFNKMGTQAVLPLIEGLDAKDDLIRANCIILLGQIRDPRAVAKLKAIHETKEETDENKKRAERALEKITGPRVTELRPAREFYLLLAEDYFYEEPKTIFPYERSEHFEDPAGEVTQWRWNHEKQVLEGRTVPIFAYNEEMAEEMCYRALKLPFADAEESLNDPAISLLLSVFFAQYKEAARLEETGKAKGTDVGKYTDRRAALERTKLLGYATGARYVHSVLARALRDGDVDVALSAMDFLAEIEDGEALPRSHVSRALRTVILTPRVIKAEQQEGGSWVIDVEEPRVATFPARTDVRLAGGGPWHTELLEETRPEGGATAPTGPPAPEGPESPPAGNGDRKPAATGGGSRPVFLVSQVEKRDEKTVDGKTVVTYVVRSLTEPAVSQSPVLLVGEDLRSVPVKPGQTLIVQAPAAAAAAAKAGAPTAPASESAAPASGVEARSVWGGRPLDEESDRSFGYPLPRALGYPDKRIKYAAANALLRINPRETFLDYERVVDVAAQAIGEGSMRSILIIDNDLQFRNRLKVVLERMGYIVYEAETAVRGLEIARRFPPEDLILLSTDLTDVKDPHEVFLNLKRDIRTADIPIIMMYPAGRKEYVEALYEQQVVRIQGKIEKSIAEDAERDRESKLKLDLDKVFSAEQRLVDENVNRANAAARLAAEAIARIDPRKTVYNLDEARPALLAAVTPNENGTYRPADLREPCIVALGNLEAEDAIKLLITTFEDQANAGQNPGSLRGKICEAIGKIVHGNTRNFTEKEHQVLRDALNDPEPLVHQAAARALGQRPLTPTQKRDILLQQRSQGLE